MIKAAEVHTLYETNARAIPDMLRGSAESIEAETDDNDRTKAMVCVQVTEEGRVEVYGWGETDNWHCISTLQLALAKMTRDALDVSEELDE